MNNKIAVSVIIPALNEEKHIGKCISSIRKNNYQLDDLEIILIDNGSTDRTVEIAGSYLGVKVIQIPKVCISELRNNGAKVAKGEILAFLDADCTVGVDWLRSGIACFDNKQIAAAGCSHQIPENSTWIEKTWYLNTINNRKKGFVEHLPSGNMMIRADVFSKIGGFDETLRTNEDYELCVRLRKHGYSIFSDPEIVAIHWGITKTLKDFYMQQYWHGTHVLKAFQKHLGEIRKLGDLAKYKVILYSVYYILCYLWLIIESSLLLMGGGQKRIGLALLAFVLPPILIGFKKVESPMIHLNKLVTLAFLFMVYGVARANSFLSSLISIRNARTSQNFRKNKMS